jgi:hypothetical protein
MCKKSVFLIAIIFCFSYVLVFAYSDRLSDTENCSTCHNIANISRLCEKDCILCHKADSNNYKYLSENYVQSFFINKKNPHEKNICAVCHVRREKMLRFDNDTMLCEKCHSEGDVSVEAHSTNFKYVETKEVRIPRDFPLNDGKVTCLTCHLFNCLDKNNFKYLRRPFSHITEFCFNCHNADEYKKYNPHIQINPDGTVNENNCIICHSVKPDIKKDKGIESILLKGEPNKICDGCHQIREAHPTGILHTVTPSSTILNNIKSYEQKRGLVFPLGKNNQILCVTCHLPHQFELIKGQAKNKYKHRTRLPEGYELCNVCHNKG